MKIHVTACPTGANGELSKHWIESPIGEQLTTSTTEFSLPEGEGQGEGKVRLLTQYWMISSYRQTVWLRLRAIMMKFSRALRS